MASLKTLDTPYWMLDAGYWMLDAGYWMLESANEHCSLQKSKIVNRNSCL